ncbi:methionyl-tRNA formyltransferase [Sandarakinorhabdus sp. AAP62]|uniref:methionyl-tRNA formyltransferase n=1 Tax=Sandarakinorhabdus sp. AAP62 TaxID=1248916 RepID=UPI0005256FBA|nr:methionyl-tRNA formyltransferase [Sandarakinorhabdus sp. AAP62]
MGLRLRIIHMGTPFFAVPALEALVAAGHEIMAVYTRAPKPAGRGKQLQMSPVHARAEALGIPVFTPRTFRDPAAVEQFLAVAQGCDVAVVAAYGLILPRAVLDAPRLGCLNIHGSLLPRWRGAAPIQRAVLAGDAVTGVTIMQMEEGLDTGPMLATVETPIGTKTSGDLFSELATLGADLLIDVLAHPRAAVPQPEDGVTLATRIDKAEAHLSPTLPAAVLERQVRGFNPAPGAWAEIGGERVKILAAEVEPGTAAPGVTVDDRLGLGTADGVLRPTLVQRAGKPAMPVGALLNGWRVPAGTRVA